MAPEHHSAWHGCKLCETSCIQQHCTVQHYWCSSGCAIWAAVMPLPAMQYREPCSSCKLCDAGDSWRSRVDITAGIMVLGSQGLCDMGPSKPGAATGEEGMPASHQATHHWWIGSSSEGSGQISEGPDRRDYSRSNRGCAEITSANLPPYFMDNQILEKLSVISYWRHERVLRDTNGVITDNGPPKPAKSEQNNYRTAILYIVIYILHCDN